MNPDIELIYETIGRLESSNIYVLLETFGIDIHYTPQMIPHKRDSMIICCGNRKGIFIKPNPNPKYIEFLLWHEFGHYILHYKPYLKMNYKLSTFRDLYEQQANIFAVFGLLHSVDLTDRKPVDAAVSLGVPAIIAADVFRTLAENRYTMR